METALNQTPKQSSWLTKFLECLFAAFMLLNVLMMASELLLPDAFNKLIGPFYFMGPGVIGLIFGLITATIWHKKEKKIAVDSEYWHSLLRAILRYWLANLVMTYGFAKILKTQFATLYYKQNIPIGDLSGFSLTWTYFNYSYTMAVILGLFQIIGALFLLFRRTALLGVCILLPVMVNIILINAFYHIATGAFVNSVLITVGLVYILALNYNKLIVFLFHNELNSTPFKFSIVKQLLRLMAIGLAFYAIFSYASTLHPSPFVGKWKVSELIKNGKTVDDDAWLKDDKAYKMVYIEEDNSVGFVPNPYVYEDARAQWANFTYKPGAKSIVLKFEKDTLKKVKVNIMKLTDSTMNWTFINHQDTLKMKLSKVIRKKK
jgi:hypothetical protein